MYGRQYGEKELRFEPSGGLLHASLVMQDKETDSYWSIMTGDALSGPFKGSKLDELPIGSKTQWREWRQAHPQTLVLSVDGVEHIDNNPYDNYFTSEATFRDAKGKDKRLKSKAPIYAFLRGDTAYAVPYSAFIGGATFQVGKAQIFLYRPKDAAIFYSTSAFISDGKFVHNEGSWHHEDSDAHFDPHTATFSAEARGIQPLDGFDTFWFNWSMTHTKSELLGKGGR